MLGTVSALAAVPPPSISSSRAPFYLVRGGGGGPVGVIGGGGRAFVGGPAGAVGGGGASILLARPGRGARARGTTQAPSTYTVPHVPSHQSRDFVASLPRRS